jgi:hypothetical protein
MKRRRSKSIKRRKISLWLGLVLALGLAVTASWFLSVTKAQTGPGGKPQSSGLRVLVKTNAGDAVTSSAGQPSDEVISDLRSFLARYPGTWRVDIDNAVVKNLKPTTPMPITSSPKDFSVNLLGEFSNVSSEIRSLL